MPNNEYDNPNDPLEIAQREGKVLGLGLKGGYRKNKVIRFGFILLGLLFFFSGLLLVYTAIYYL